MTCYHPSRVPIRRKNQYGRGIKDVVQVPCGNCLGCRGEQSRQWAVRMMHESQMHDVSWFLTLTYDDEEIPQYGSLYPEDFSRFIKDLRKRYAPGSVSYYGCGEYGNDSQRPHYHAVLFGTEFLDRYRHPDSDRVGVWKSETLDDIWGHGITELGSLTMASASYVSGYVRKKVELRDNPNYYDRVDAETGELVEVQPEFSRMSLRPAIGGRWLEKFWTDVYPRDYVVVDGIQCKPPRYYDKWMDFPDDKGGSREKRDIMIAVRDTRWDEVVQLDARKLESKEKIHKSRVELFNQRLKL